MVKIVINVFKEVIRNELRMMEVEEEGKEKVLKEERGKVREGRSRGENEEEVLRKKVGKGEGKEGSKREEEKIDEIEKDMVGRGKEMIRIERIVGKIKEEFIKIDEERIVDELKGGLREIFKMIEERGKRESKRWNKKDGDVWVRGDGKEDGRGKRKDGKNLRLIIFIIWWGGIVRKEKKKKMKVNFKRMRDEELKGNKFC